MEELVKDMVGIRFGLWIVMKRVPKKPKAWWMCKCDCGNEKIIIGGNLRSGKSTSCGCKNKFIRNIGNAIQERTVLKENGCLEWIGARSTYGYALYGNKTIVMRYIWEKNCGKIPKGMCVCHNCPGGDNKGCININHLWLGTIYENNRDRKNKGGYIYK